MRNPKMKKIKDNFPALKQKIHNKPLVYLDSGASSLKPQIVIDAVSDYYATINSNVHRGAHHLSMLATEAYEAARDKVKLFINAGSSQEIIFTKGTTESINLVAQSFGDTFINEGDEIIVSQLEHHANIVPWQQVCQRKGAILKVVPIHKSGQLKMDVYRDLLSDKTKLVAITHISNSLGVINPIKEIIQLGHQKKAAVLIDGAQGVVHQQVDVQDLEADFYVFSGHKLYAPMGIGVLYGKKKYLEKMTPYQFGGEMIDKVSFEETTFNALPFKFEAGTPNVGGAIGLHKAIEFIESYDFEELLKKENDLLDYATQRLTQIEGLKIYGTASPKVCLISFLIQGLHPYDVGTLLDQMGIAVRTGNHCTQPLMKFLEIPGTIRASFGIYNDKNDVDALYDALLRIKSML